MAHKEMPIFTRTFDFLTWLLPATNGFPRAHRRSGVVCCGSVADRRCNAGAVQREEGRLLGQAHVAEFARIRADSRKSCDFRCAWMI